MIKNLIFDFGKVLICYDYQSFLKTIFDDDGERLEFEKIVCSIEFTQRCDLGVEPFIDIIREFQEKFPYWKRPLQEFHDRQLDAMTIEMPGMRDLLTRLKANGYRLYGLTNWSNTVYPVIEKFSILQMMDDRLISSEEHLVKPDVAIYNRLCEKFGLVKEECLFTDDKQINIDGAKAAGMPAVLFTDVHQFEEDLNGLEVCTISTRNSTKR
ncbi:MAG: HAD family phosphatase [Muribaculaceae bacterium]|nr:HAD family phosphatase [Muribaculaceae bacterium]